MTDTPPTRRVRRESPVPARLSSPAGAAVRTGSVQAATVPAGTAQTTTGRIDAGEIPLATMAQAPRRRATLLTAAPAFAPAPVEVPSAGTAPVRLGWDGGRSSLAIPARPIRPLETSSDVLPELAETPEKARSLWLHPASIVSMATTVVALIALGVFLMIGMLSPGTAASGLALTVGDDNVRATWSGPEVPYQLLVVGGPGGESVDVSQLVTGTEAWIPRAAGLVDERSCLVVRPASAAADAVSLDADALAAQGASSACVADAQN